MDQTGRLGSVLCVVEHCPQHLPMQRLLAKRGKRAFDSLACELVPEGHRRVIQGQHAAGEAFLQRKEAEPRTASRSQRSVRLGTTEAISSTTVVSEGEKQCDVCNGKAVR